MMTTARIAPTMAVGQLIVCMKFMFTFLIR